MTLSLRRVFAIVISLAILGVLWYGTILPLRKSTAFISALGKTSGARTFNELTDILSVPLDMRSPIGQEELVRNVAGSIAGLIQAKGESVELTRAGIDYLNRYYDPIMRRGHGMSFEQNLFLLGTIHEVAYIKTKDPVYLAEAKRYLEWGRDLGPQRPQFLYGLLDVYRLLGDVEHATQIAQEILTLWPNDERLKTLLVPQQ